MPPGSMEYTLVGFSPELDWRPLRFVKPLPAYRVCGACGLVRSKSALLPCSHTLCESCYDLSAKDGVRVCPLDGHHCEEEDVDMKQFPADELFRREVKCWNEGKNCSAVLPVSTIVQHFQCECRHHSVRCPRCSATILCTEVCAHLESGCSSNAAPARSECEGNSSSRDETALLTSFRQMLEEQAGEIKTVLGLLLSHAGSNDDRLNEVVHGVNNCQEVLGAELRLGLSSVKDMAKLGLAHSTDHRHEMAAFCGETKERLVAGSDTMNTILNNMRTLEKLLKDELAKADTGKRDNGSQTVRGSGLAREQVEESCHAVGRTVMDVPRLADTGKQDNGSQTVRGPGLAREQVEESCHAVGRMVAEVPRLPNLPASVFEFVVKGVTSLADKAAGQGKVIYEGEKVQLQSCTVTPGIVFQCYRDNVELRALFSLHNPDVDVFVKRLIERRIKVYIVHPKRAAQRLLAVGCAVEKFFPGTWKEERSMLCYEYFKSLRLDDLHRDGYVQGDQLRVKGELLP